MDLFTTRHQQALAILHHPISRFSDSQAFRLSGSQALRWPAAASAIPVIRQALITNGRNRLWQGKRGASAVAAWPKVRLTRQISARATVLTPGA